MRRPRLSPWGPGDAREHGRQFEFHEARKAQLTISQERLVASSSGAGSMGALFKRAEQPPTRPEKWRIVEHHHQA